MDWENYREMLGIPYSDNQRFLKFENIILNELDDYFDFLYDRSYNRPVIVSSSDYKQFCNTLGIRMKHCDFYENHSEIILELKNRQHNFKEFVFCYIALINCLSKTSDASIPQLIKILEKAFNDSCIRFEVLKDDENYFVFPNGAKELDTALVIDNLIWLKDYKLTHKIFTQTLYQYSNKENPRDIADNLRKVLEQFLQEFFNNTKTLSKNISEVGKFFDEKHVHHELKNIFTSLITGYNNANNGIAKHHDNANDNMLEFLLYQTGVFIRTLITLKKA